MAFFVPDEPDTIEELIEQAALENVRRVAVDSVSVEGHSLRDLIEADKYTRQQDEAAAALPTVGLIRRRQIPGGCG